MKNELLSKTDIAEAAVLTYPALKGKAAYGSKELQINGAFTDPSFFKVFGFRLSVGNEKKPLNFLMELF